MAISNKDKIIFDYWDHCYLSDFNFFDDSNHLNSTYETSQINLMKSEFILCYDTLTSQLVKELYGRY